MIKNFKPAASFGRAMLFIALVLGAPARAYVPGSSPVNSANLNAAYTSTINGEGTVAFVINGLTASGATLTLEWSGDNGTTWSAFNADTGTSTFTADGQVRANIGARSSVRLRVSNTGSGSISIASTAALASSSVAISGGTLPAGTNPLGSVIVTHSALTTLTQTIVPCSTSDTVLLAANSSRKYLAIEVVGSYQVTISPGTSAAVFGTGLMLSSGGSGPTQGASQVFDAVVSVDAFHCIATVGTSNVLVWEGN